jgi:tryptophan synthase alpha subunit
LLQIGGPTAAVGGRQQDLESFIGRVRARSDVPLAVGFGISTPAQASAVAALADGVIVGSALINTVDSAANKPAAAAAFTKSLLAALGN